MLCRESLTWTTFWSLSISQCLYQVITTSISIFKERVPSMTCWRMLMIVQLSKRPCIDLQNVKNMLATSITSFEMTPISLTWLSWTQASFGPLHLHLSTCPRPFWHSSKQDPLKNSTNNNHCSYQYSNLYLYQREPKQQWRSELHFRVHPSYFNKILKKEHACWSKCNELMEFAQLNWVEDKLKHCYIMEFFRGFDKKYRVVKWREIRVEIMKGFVQKVFHLKGRNKTPSKAPKNWKSKLFEELTEKRYLLPRCSDQIIREKIEFTLTTLNILYVCYKVNKHPVYDVEEKTKSKKSWVDFFYNKFWKILASIGNIEVKDVIHFKLRSHSRVLFNEFVAARPFLINTAITLASYSLSLN